LHYFASRHGFRAPGDTVDEQDNVLTWPEGNAWLARKLAEPLRERMHTGRVVLRVSEGGAAVTVDVWNDVAQRAERWTAPQVVLAVPLFVAARLMDSPPAELTEAAVAMPHAPWLVGNLHLDDALDEHPRRAALLGQRGLRRRRSEPYAGIRRRDAPEHALYPGPDRADFVLGLGRQHARSTRDAARAAACRALDGVVRRGGPRPGACPS
jgi:hypothetical protein